jgi:hypothetical protein
MTRIYRIARHNAFSVGLYTAETARYHMQDCLRHPLPYEDDGVCDLWKELGMDLYFGFRSKAQLKFWVHKKAWREELSHEGYVVYVVEPLGDYALGDTQAVFHKNMCRICGKLSLVDV